MDALEALGPHRDATILVGAQAIYLHTGEAELAVAEYTIDADLALDPELLDEIPPLEQALQDAGFLHMGKSGVGVWKTSRPDRDGGDVEVQVDLLVPSAVSPGRGRRAARLPGHDDNAARKVDGLEGVLIDQVEMEIGSLDPDNDPRRITAKVAGPGALLVAKLFKISERKGTARANDKDALDVLRILQGIETETLAESIALMHGDERSRAATERATELFEELFGTRGSEGSVMAARATQPLMDEDQVRLTCEVLAGDLLAVLGEDDD
nr:GSU2403 family nucleotidyltransferase fold protein [Pseudenhygromyxa sp. WMMC2535]